MKAAAAIPAARSLLAAAILLSACTSRDVTNPPRSATEQLLISTAVDRAAVELATALPVAGTFFLDPVNLDGSDGRYALGAVRDALLRQGVRVVDDRGTADYVIEVRSGAMSINGQQALVGLPSISLPLIQGLATPEIALFSQNLHQGIVKLAGTAYDPHTGRLIASSGSRYGFSHQADWTALLFFSWATSDLPADDVRPIVLPWD